MNKHLTALALALAFLLAGCQGLTPAENQELVDLSARIGEITRQLEAGEIGADRLPQMVAELTAATQRANELREKGEGSPVDWGYILTGTLSAAAAFFGVELRRGSIHNRKGEPPAKTA